MTWRALSISARRAVTWRALSICPYVKDIMVKRSESAVRLVTHVDKLVKRDALAGRSETNLTIPRAFAGRGAWEVDEFSEYYGDWDFSFGVEDIGTVELVKEIFEGYGYNVTYNAFNYTATLLMKVVWSTAGDVSDAWSEAKNIIKAQVRRCSSPLVVLVLPGRPQVVPVLAALVSSDRS